MFAKTKEINCGPVQCLDDLQKLKSVADEQGCRLEELEPEIVILDIGMPKLDGIESLKEIKNRGIETKIIVLTIYIEEQYIMEVIRAGAMDYVQKGAVDTELFIKFKRKRSA